MTTHIEQASKDYLTSHIGQSKETLQMFMAETREKYGLTYEKIALLTGFSPNTVKAWFCREGAASNRAVPELAVTAIKMAIVNGKLVRKPPCR